MSTNTSSPPPPPVAPLEFAGQWVAWDHNRKAIVAHGADLIQVHAEAKECGHPDAILQRVHRPDFRFIGRP